MKMLGTPMDTPSPWRVWKISGLPFRTASFNALGTVCLWLLVDEGGGSVLMGRVVSEGVWRVSSGESRFGEED